MCRCVCVCASCARVCLSIVSVCGCARMHKHVEFSPRNVMLWYMVRSVSHRYMYAYIHMHVYIYIYAFVCAIYFHLCVRREGGNLKFITDALVLRRSCVRMLSVIFFWDSFSPSSFSSPFIRCEIFSSFVSHINYHFIRKSFFRHLRCTRFANERERKNESNEKLHLIFIHIQRANESIHTFHQSQQCRENEILDRCAFMTFAAFVRVDGN